LVLALFIDPSEGTLLYLQDTHLPAAAVVLRVLLRVNDSFMVLLRGLIAFAFTENDAQAGLRTNSFIKWGFWVEWGE
jgi:hypothetical protein